MKSKFKKIIAALVLVFTISFVASCGRANTYRKWSNSGSSLPKTHCIEEISYSKLVKLVEETKDTKDSEGNTVAKYIYVYFGNPGSSSANSDIVIYNEQCQQYLINKLYWLDSDLSEAKLKKLEDRLGIYNSNVESAIFSFRNQTIAFDSTSVTCNKDGNKVLTTIEMAQNCFKNLVSRY